MEDAAACSPSPDVLGVMGRPCRELAHWTVMDVSSRWGRQGERRDPRVKAIGGKARRPTTQPRPSQGKRRQP
nr:MAG TPA: hypothetical protein [Caudoviricetes sp.]